MARRIHFGRMAILAHKIHLGGMVIWLLPRLAGGGRDRRMRAGYHHPAFVILTPCPTLPKPHPMA